MKEIWKPIVGFEDLYLVSNKGRIKSLKRKRVKKDYILNSSPSHKKHLIANIGGTNIGVHRLVAMAFIPNPYNNSVVHHIDNNPQNNNVTNLMWLSHYQNITDGKRKARLKKLRSLYTKKQVIDIKKMVQKKCKYYEILIKYRLNYYQVKELIYTPISNFK